MFHPASLIFVILFMKMDIFNCQSYVYDLLVDPTEKVNQVKNAAYPTSVLVSNATSWMSKYNAPDIPSSTGQSAAFAKAGGSVPWLSDSVSDRVITQKYSYSSAPHIIFLLVDDWGYNDVGYQSTYLNWTTPNIDKLMRAGIRLDNYFTHELCGPSRAALLTGRYALRFGLHGNTVDTIELPLTEVTLAEEMKSAGYRTNLVGKWHMGFSTWSKTPTHRGFDSFYGYYGGEIDYWTKANGNWLDLHDETSLVTDSYALSTSTHSAYLYQQKAEAVIRNHALNHASQPMFMYYASQLIHETFGAPPHFIARCVDATSTLDQQTYCGMNLMLDEVVGNLTCALKANGMFDNTLFVLVSDNGGLPSMTGNSYPFKGAKGSVFRGGSSAMGLVFGSSNLIPAINQGSTYSGIMHVTDWLPTLMGVATNGAWTGSYTGATIDGVDMFDALLGGSGATHRHEIVHFLNAAGNISYQYDWNKVMVNLVKQAPANTPAHYFSGPATGSAPALDVCSFLDELSATPRFAPTAAPSFAAPTVLPTMTPTAPTKKPQATSAPSRMPSVIPSTVQPSVPTVQPSLLPSAAPSVLPTVQPSVLPSTSPSVLPSLLPSVLPSAKPKMLPSVLPSMLPSALPSELPSMTPTMKPIRRPISTPSSVTHSVSVSLVGLSVSAMSDSAQQTLRFAIRSAVSNVTQISESHTTLPTLSEVGAEDGLTVRRSVSAVTTTTIATTMLTVDSLDNNVVTVSALRSMLSANHGDVLIAALKQSVSVVGGDDATEVLTSVSRITSTTARVVSIVDTTPTLNPTVSPNTTNSHSSSALNQSVIIGVIVAGVVILLVVIAFVLYRTGRNVPNTKVIEMMTKEQHVMSDSSVNGEEVYMSSIRTQHNDFMKGVIV